MHRPVFRVVLYQHEKLNGFVAHHRALILRYRHPPEIPVPLSCCVRRVANRAGGGVGCDGRLFAARQKRAFISAHISDLSFVRHARSHILYLSSAA